MYIEICECKDQKLRDWTVLMLPPFPVYFINSVFDAESGGNSTKSLAGSYYASWFRILDVVKICHRLPELLIHTTRKQTVFSIVEPSKVIYIEDWFWDFVALLV
jgi:hypothetical protein